MPGSIEQVKIISFGIEHNKNIGTAWLASAVSVAFEEVKDRSCSPEANTDYLLDKFKFFGGTGILTIAFAAIDMASWDLLGRALGKPLYRLWGGTNTPIPSYESSGLAWEALIRFWIRPKRF